MDNTIKHIVEDYYKSILFLNVPNKCNNSCYYCYANPDFSNSSFIPYVTLESVKGLLAIVKELGFNELRISGGEPLIYSNIYDLISNAINLGFEYSIITNGMLLETHMRILTSTKPKKVSVSYNSYDNWHIIPGSRVDNGLLDYCITRLIAFDVSTSINIVVLKENLAYILSIITRLYGFGIREFKLIFPNSSLSGISERDYSIILYDLSCECIDANVRVSDLSYKHCMLKERGFVHINLPKMQFSNCCLNTNKHNSIKLSEGSSIDNVKATMLNMYNTAHKEFACSTKLAFCPIALKQLSDV